MTKESKRAPSASNVSVRRRLKFIFGTTAALLTAVLLLAAAKSDFFEEKTDALVYRLQELTLSLDLRVDQVLVKGRKRTPPKVLMNALNAPAGMPILAVNLKQAKENISLLPWVKSVRVERRLPHTLYVDLTERKPIAVWQLKQDKKHVYHPIDSEGVVVNADIKNLKGLPLIVGENAPKRTPNLLAFLKQEPALYARVRAATFMGERRWDITLDSISDGIVVKLPEKNPESEWSRLVRLDKTHGLLKRTVTMIDLRFPDKVVVRFEELKKEKTKSSSVEIKKETGI